MYLTAFLDYLRLERNYSKHTIAAYEQDIESFFNYAEEKFSITEPAHVSYTIIRSYIVELGNNITTRSINRKMSSLRAFYKFLQKIGEVENSPLKKHKALKVSKKIQIPFSSEEVNNVFNLTEELTGFEAVRDRLMIELFYGTGMRRSELINLKRSDIDYESGTVKVLGKRNKERLLLLLQPVLDTLRQYDEEKSSSWPKSQEPWLLLNNKGVKMHETFVYRKIKSYFSKVSPKVKTSPHMLRHTFATHLLNHGADLNAVKELLGHTSLAATQVYTHNSIAELTKVHNAAHPRNTKR